MLPELFVWKRFPSNMFQETLSIERNPFPAKNQTLKILQSIYFAHGVGIISSYSNRIFSSYSESSSSALIQIECFTKPDDCVINAVTTKSTLFIWAVSKETDVLIRRSQMPFAELFAITCSLLTVLFKHLHCKYIFFVFSGVIDSHSEEATNSESQDMWSSSGEILG